jgi:hypothetical protein
MPLTRQGGYITASATRVTFFNTKGSWTQSQYTPYQTNYSWPKQFNTVMFSGHGNNGGSVRAFPWTGSNFGPEYTPISGTPASGADSGVAPHPSGSVVFAQGNTAGRLYAWPFSISTGFGTKWAATSNTLSLANNSLRCPPVGNYLFFFNSTNNVLYSVSFNLATSTFGTINSVTSIGGAVRSKFSRDGYAWAAGSSGTPSINILRIDPYTGASNGANYAVPAAVAGATGVGFDWTPAMDAFVCATSNGTARHKTFSWTNANGAGTQYAAPTGFVDMPMTQAFFNTTGTVIFFVGTLSPFIQAYKWDSGTGFGTKYANPPSIPTVTSIQEATLSASNDIIMITISTEGSSYGVLWNDETGFGTSISYPGAGVPFARIVGAAVTL